MSSPADNESAIAAYLRADGFTPIATAGVLGNLQVESGFNPAAYNANEGAIGLAQWEGGRRTDGLDQLAAQRGTSETDLGTQLAWLATEVNSMPGFLARLNAAANPAAAAALWDSEFERSSGSSRAERQANAAAAYSVAQNPGTAAPAGVVPASFPGSGVLGAFPPTAPWVAGAEALSGLASSASGKVASTIGQFAANAALKLTFIGTGAVLVVLGLYHASAPVREKAESSAQSAAAVAKTAAVAA